MVKISFMGGTHEVGKNAVLLETGEARVLLDYGVRIGDKPDFPSHVRARDVDGIILSHAHLDHSGGIPLFYLREEMPFFATPPTIDIMGVLVKDMIKLSGYFLPFEYLDYESMMKQRQPLGYGNEVNLKGVNFRLSNAGHIPGSAMVELNAKGKNILYTGDINTAKTRLVHDARVPRQRFDAVVIESTYATTEHEERKGIEEAFVKAVKEVIRKDGKVLVPAFAVGRSQEMLAVLNAHKVNATTVVDGMARAIIQILLDHQDYIKTPKTFEKVVNGTQQVRGWRDRRNAVRRANVIVAPSGMLQGGTAVYYMERLALGQENAVFLVSYQVPGTGGAKLMETGLFPIREKDEKVMADVRHFDFSSHCGKSELEAFLRGLKGKPDVYVIHGEPESCDSLAQWVRDELDLKAVAPNEGDEFEV